MPASLNFGDPEGSRQFVLSSTDFREQARAGASFWRGVFVGFVCAFPFSYFAATGTPLIARSVEMLVMWFRLGSGTGT